MSNYQRLKISLTDDCNLNCAHCYLGMKNKVYIFTDLLYKRIDEAKELGVQIIDLTGGEPTLHKDFIKIVNYIGEKGFSIHVCTNGISLLRNDILNVLQKYKVRCNISLDGVSKDVIKSMRGYNLLEKLEPTFNELKLRDIPFTLRFSLNKNNFRDLEKMIKYSEQIHPLGILINVTQLIGNANDSIILDNNDINIAKSIISNMRSEISVIFSECFTSPEQCDGAFSELLSITTQGKPVGCFMIPQTYLNDATDDMSLKEL